jgi:hypothetical protein
MLKPVATQQQYQSVTVVKCMVLWLHMSRNVMAMIVVKRSCSSDLRSSEATTGSPGMAPLRDLLLKLLLVRHCNNTLGITWVG